MRCALSKNFPLHTPHLNFFSDFVGDAGIVGGIGAVGDVVTVGVGLSLFGDLFFLSCFATSSVVYSRGSGFCCYR